jgi:23S rRNA pseudouridine1911/1915/1917 synthase
LTEELQILYEDNHLLGVFKPGGLLSQGDRTGDTTALVLAKRYLKEKYNKPGNVFLGLVHRIDRPVSGVLVFARTSKAASRLAREFQNRSVEKVYLAVVAGSVEEDSGELVAYIERVRNRSRVVAPPKTRAEDSNTYPAGDAPRPLGSSKRATLKYRVLDRRSGLTLLEIQPGTGRHHQIRVQLSGVSHPIVGDLKYGAGEPLPDKTIALHAAILRFDHPTRDEIVNIEVAPPKGRPWSQFRSTIESYFGRGGSKHRPSHRRG